MKEFWLKVINWNKKLVTAGIESGVDVIMTEDENIERVKELGLVKVASKNGDLKEGVDYEIIRIESKEDEIRAIETSKHKIVIVETTDWMVIPLENLVAQSDNIIALVKNPEEAELAVGVLEKGTRGILLETEDPSIVKEVGNLVKRRRGKLNLVEAEVISVEPGGMGYRTCIDTTDIMTTGEGMLVGDKSDTFLLVHSESIENPYVAPRPFRVNAGGIHAYVMMADGKTKYLYEVSTGDKVLVVDYKGNTREALVGRAKIELRPLIVVKVKIGEDTASLVLQNAETIRLTKIDGTPVSVVKLKKGDKVLAYKTEGGRHFGIKVKESIKEK